jgi:hypothetical protein
VGRGAFFLPNHVIFVLKVFRTRLRVEKACWTLRKLYCRAFNTKSEEGPAEYKTIICIYMDSTSALLAVLGFRLGFGKALCDNGCYKKCFINTFD